MNPHFPQISETIKLYLLLSKQRTLKKAPKQCSPSVELSSDWCQVPHNCRTFVVSSEKKEEI